MTALQLIERAKNIADIANTDFLTYTELEEYLNDAWKQLYQQIINHNLDVFTNKATLVGANGRYKLPFDFYQMKTIHNPYTGSVVLRRSDTEGIFSGHYHIDNGFIEITNGTGPIEIVYWRKPFYLSFPNISKAIDEVDNILSTCNDSILYVYEDKLEIYNTSTGDKLPLPIEYDYEKEYILCKGLIYSEGVFYKYDGTIYYSVDTPHSVIRSNNGLLYTCYVKADDPNTLEVYKLDKKVNELPIGSYLCVDNIFIEAPEGAFPFGIFDGRPSYLYDESLILVNDDGSKITEPLDLPIMKVDCYTKYGVVSDGTLYSGIPDTLLDLPSNIYFDLIAYNLAIRFLCKQNADSSGVESLYKTALGQFLNSIDYNSGYQRMANVRR